MHLKPSDLDPAQWTADELNVKALRRTGNDLPRCRDAYRPGSPWAMPLEYRRGGSRSSLGTARSEWTAAVRMDRSGSDGPQRFDERNQPGNWGGGMSRKIGAAAGRALTDAFAASLLSVCRGAPPYPLQTHDDCARLPASAGAACACRREHRRSAGPHRVQRLKGCGIEAR
ncbi:hypothetical protein GCM10022207_58660 [Streptomyces lannensis]|uniref:Transposase n=1 Tax=Streptomyces lannensis TaxID=766498 RepID=A0ABP7KRM0_9ACTN